MSKKRERRIRANRVNALRHGITSNSPVIPGMESEEAWIEHRDKIVEDWDPRGHFERVLAERIALLLWCQFRVTRYQVAVTMSRLNDMSWDIAVAANYPRKEELVLPEPLEIEERRFTHIIPSGGTLDKIMRYQAALHRECIQLIHELEAFQAHRRGEPTHLARLSFGAPPMA